MSSPDVVLGFAEVGSSAVSALLSSHTSLALPAACTRSFTHARSLHSRTAPKRSDLAQHLRCAHRRPSLHPSLAAPLSRCVESRSFRWFTARPPSASLSTSSATPSSSQFPASSLSAPARLPADFDGSNVSNVANPRHFQPPSFISDAARHLSSEQQQHLSIRLDALHSQLGTQLAVVTVRSVAVPDGATVREWAVRLFNQWGVGRRQENDGILLLLVEQQRRVEVVLGDGCKRQYGLSNSVVQHVVNERMLPWFKEGQFGMGLVEGVSAIEQLVRQSQQGQPLAGKTTLLSKEESGTGGGVGNGGGGDTGGAGNDGNTGWGGGGTSTQLPYNPRFMKGVLAVVAGFIALRVLTGPSNSYSTSSSSQPSRCSRCQGKLKLIGVVDRGNLSSTAAFDSSALQSIARPDTPSATSSPSFSSLPSDDDNSPFTLTERNLYQADYRVDYQHALDSLSPQQAEKLRQPGVQYQVFVCPDCSTLYLQESEAEERRPLADVGDRLFDRTPFIGVGSAPGDGGRLSGLGGGAMSGAAAAGGSGRGGSSRQPEVVWLPSAERRVKGVRRESNIGGSSGSGGSGFGGGTSSGGGAGGSF